VKIISGNDTVRIIQKGIINNKIRQLIELLEAFHNGNEHKVINSIGFWETEAVVVPMPPAIRDTNMIN
jgi:hypothetical protein